MRGIAPMSNYLIGRNAIVRDRVVEPEIKFS